PESAAPRDGRRSTRRDGVQRSATSARRAFAVAKPGRGRNDRCKETHFPRQFPTSRHEAAGFPASGLPREVCRRMRMLKRAKRPDPGMDRRECEVDAELAAEMAGQAAALASEWAQRAGIGEDDAAEAVSAATRARLAAERAASAKTDE